MIMRVRSSFDCHSIVLPTVAVCSTSQSRFLSSIVSLKLRVSEQIIMALNKSCLECIRHGAKTRNLKKFRQQSDVRSFFTYVPEKSTSKGKFLPTYTSPKKISFFRSACPHILLSNNMNYCTIQNIAIMGRLLITDV